ncbi:MAG: hypothetical protein ACTSYO_02830 [Candidatus Ranarchaeia archaeon]
MPDNPRQRAYFDSLAERWDDITYHDPLKLKLIAKMLDIQPGETVLDVVQAQA